MRRRRYTIGLGMDREEAPEGEASEREMEEINVNQMGEGLVKTKSELSP